MGVGGTSVRHRASTIDFAATVSARPITTNTLSPPVLRGTKAWSARADGRPVPWRAHAPCGRRSPVARRVTRPVADDNLEGEQ